MLYMCNIKYIKLNMETRVVAIAKEYLRLRKVKHI